MASLGVSNLQAIIDEMKADKMPGIELSVVITNKEDCYALQRAKEQGYETVYIDPENEDLDKEAFKHLEDIDLIVLVGFMRILSSEFVNPLSKSH